jgi:hypothetical protein
VLYIRLGCYIVFFRLDGTDERYGETALFCSSRCRVLIGRRSPGAAWRDWDRWIGRGIAITNLGRGPVWGRRRVHSNSRAGRGAGRRDW